MLVLHPFLISTPKFTSWVCFHPGFGTPVGVVCSLQVPSLWRRGAPWPEVGFLPRRLAAIQISVEYTLPETNMAPENGWLEDEFPFGKAYFQGRTVSFREGKCQNLCLFFLVSFNFLPWDSSPFFTSIWGISLSKSKKTMAFYKFS